MNKIMINYRNIIKNILKLFVLILCLFVFKISYATVGYLKFAVNDNTGENNWFEGKENVICTNYIGYNRANYNMVDCATYCMQEISQCIGIQVAINKNDKFSRCILFRTGESIACNEKREEDYAFLKNMSYGSSPDPKPDPGRKVFPFCDPSQPGYDPNKCNSYHQAKFPKTGDMLIYPRIIRTKDPRQGEVSPADAILGQTSYFARVLTQANDTFPPSHLSSRVSGETYNSAVIPVDYNTKALTQAAVQRNTLGDPPFDNNPKNKNSDDEYTKQSTVIRDWVNYHFNSYCDPLALANGLCSQDKLWDDCVKKDISIEDKENGITKWEACKGITDKDKKIMLPTFAADIDASTIFKDIIVEPEAAMRYIYNVTNILPTPVHQGSLGSKPGSGSYTIPKTTEKNGRKVLEADGYIEYMNFIENQSKMSLSQYALMKLFAERIALDNIKIPVEKWLKKDDGSDKLEGKKETDFIRTSKYGLMQFEATKRFASPNWYDRLQQMPEQAVLKEIAYMQATLLALDFKRYEQQQIQAALLASATSDTAKLLAMAKNLGSSLGGGGDNSGGSPLLPP